MVIISFLLQALATSDALLPLLSSAGGSNPFGHQRPKQPFVVTRSRAIRRLPARNQLQRRLAVLVHRKNINATIDGERHVVVHAPVIHNLGNDHVTRHPVHAQQMVQQQNLSLNRNARVMFKKTDGTSPGRVRFTGAGDGIDHLPRNAVSSFP